MKEEIKLIPIESIRILNPREREPKKFQSLVQSIKNLGLKSRLKLVCVPLRKEMNRGMTW